MLVTFANGVIKTYDCTPLISEEAFSALTNDAVFRSVRADTNGYGIVWNEKIDLAESELWINGEETEQGATSDTDEPRP